DADGRPVVVLGRRGVAWQATVQTTTGRWQSAPNGLAATIMQVKEDFFRWPGVVLAHAEYRQAFYAQGARVRVEPQTRLEREELLVLIDVVGMPFLLDLTDCYLFEVDLSRDTVQRE